MCFPEAMGLPGIIEKMNGKIRSSAHSLIWLATSLADCMWHPSIMPLLLDQAGDSMQNRNICSSTFKIPMVHENSGSGNTCFSQELLEINTTDTLSQWVAKGYPTVLTIWVASASLFPMAGTKSHWEGILGRFWDAPMWALSWKWPWPWEVKVT